MSDWRGRGGHYQWCFLCWENRGVFCVGKTVFLKKKPKVRSVWGWRRDGHKVFSISIFSWWSAVKKKIIIYHTSSSSSIFVGVYVSVCVIIFFFWTMVSGDAHKKKKTTVHLLFLYLLILNYWKKKRMSTDSSTPDLFSPRGLPHRRNAANDDGSSEDLVLKKKQRTHTHTHTINFHAKK